jgi:hypothetical protein
MSPRSSKPPAKKRGAEGPAPVADVYVALLFLSVGAIAMGIVFLWMELNAYGWSIPGG